MKEGDTELYTYDDRLWRKEPNGDGRNTCIKTRNYHLVTSLRDVDDRVLCEDSKEIKRRVRIINKVFE